MGKWVTWTSECSGCFEGGENGGLAENYPWDEKAKCRIGMGCQECGYTGKRRFRMLASELSGTGQADGT